MKITKTQLRQIIREEIQKLNEKKNPQQTALALHDKLGETKAEKAVKKLLMRKRVEDMSQDFTGVVKGVQHIGGGHYDVEIKLDGGGTDTSDLDNLIWK